MSSLCVNGYVHSLVDDNLDFKQFMSQCAYGFGALYSYRDSGSRTELPDNIEIDKYYLETHPEAVKEYELLLSMNEEERIQKGKADIEKTLKMWQESREKSNKETQIVKEMYQKVSAWVPPTDEHYNYKNTILEWLSQGVDEKDYYQKEIDKLSKMTPLEMFNEDLAAAKRKVEYTKKDMEKAIQRNQENNAWIQAIKNSF